MLRQSEHPEFSGGLSTNIVGSNPAGCSSIILIEKNKEYCAILVKRTKITQNKKNVIDRYAISMMRGARFKMYQALFQCF
jgi:hypothetical protein